MSKSQWKTGYTECQTTQFHNESIAKYNHSRNIDSYIKWHDQTFLLEFGPDEIKLYKALFFNAWALNWSVPCVGVVWCSCPSVTPPPQTVSVLMECTWVYCPLYALLSAGCLCLLCSLHVQLQRSELGFSHLSSSPPFDHNYSPEASCQRLSLLWRVFFVPPCFQNSTVLPYE